MPVPNEFFDPTTDKHIKAIKQQVMELNEVELLMQE